MSELTYLSVTIRCPECEAPLTRRVPVTDTGVPLLSEATHVCEGCFPWDRDMAEAAYHRTRRAVAATHQEAA